MTAVNLYAPVDLVYAQGPQREDPTAIKLGPRIAQLRQQQGQTVATLAKQVGISQRLLVKIEEGSHSPRIDLLQRLLIPLRADIAAFLSMSETAHKRTRRVITRAVKGCHPADQGNTQEGLGGGLKPQKMQPIRTRLMVDGSGTFQDVHVGEVFLMVLRGTVVLRLPAYQPVLLAQGDSVYFDGGKGYQIDNAEAKDADLLRVAALE